MWHYFALGLFTPEMLRSINETERQGKRLS